MRLINQLVFVSLLSLLAASSTASVAQTLEQRPAPEAVQSAPNASQAASNEMPVVPAGTSLQVEVAHKYPMKVGEAIEGRLLHPIYVNNQLVVPSNTPLQGKVIALEPDKKTRLQGRLRGDFTPFHTAEVRFDQLVLPGGVVAISAAFAEKGAPVIHLSTPGVAPKTSFVAREWAQAKSQLHDRIAFFTAPGKGDRALQMLYHQLPYHPERIEAHTAWNFELTEPLTLPVAAINAPETAVAPPAGVHQPEAWWIHADLAGAVTSATAKPGDAVQALVIEPVYDKDRQMVVPQGSILVGHVTTAKAARPLGRNGKLRFTFQEIRFPEGVNRQVEGSLAGASTEKTQNLSLDAEGTITPRSQASAIAPLLLTMLAGRALDQDGNMYADTGVASNGFGVIGRIVGMAAGNRNIAAGIGFYAAGLSFYQNFLRSGHDVVFPKDTRIEIQTTPLRAPVLKPEGQ